MVRKNRLKQFGEKHYKIDHPKVKSLLNQEILRSFSKHLTATQTAKHVNVDVRTINPFYQWVRSIIDKHYQEFISFRQNNMDEELQVFLSHSAMATMYWLNTDAATQWDNHTMLLSGEAQFQDKSSDELMRYTLADKQRKERYQRHYLRNFYWLNERLIEYRSKKLRTSMLDGVHASETIYRLMITMLVLNHSELDKDIAQNITGRFIGEGESLQKVGVINIDEMFERYFIHQHHKTISGLIFNDLMDWLTHHPDA